MLVASAQEWSVDVVVYGPLTMRRANGESETRWRIGGSGPVWERQRDARACGSRVKDSLPGSAMEVLLFVADRVRILFHALPFLA